VKFLVRHW